MCSSTLSLAGRFTVYSVRQGLSKYSFFTSKERAGQSAPPSFFIYVCLPRMRQMRWAAPNWSCMRAVMGAPRGFRALRGTSRGFAPAPHRPLKRAALTFGPYGSLCGAAVYAWSLTCYSLYLRVFCSGEVIEIPPNQLLGPGDLGGRILIHITYDQQKNIIPQGDNLPGLRLVQLGRKVLLKRTEPPCPAAPPEPSEPTPPCRAWPSPQ